MEYRIKNTASMRKRIFPNSKFQILYATPRGFSAIELMLVIAILAIILATVLPSFMSFRRNSLLNGETMELVTIINRARILSVSSKDDNRYGVHLESGKVVLFKGATYDVASTTNEVHSFGTGLTMSSFSINGGGSEILFEKVTGETTQNATSTLLVTGTTASTTVLVYPTGIATIK